MDSSVARSMVLASKFARCTCWACHSRSLKGRLNSSSTLARGQRPLAKTGSVQSPPQPWLLSTDFGGTSLMGLAEGSAAGAAEDEVVHWDMARSAPERGWS